MGADPITVPPGRLGLPWLGETLSVLRDPFEFLEHRRRRYGPVFKSRLLGRPTIFLSGPEGAEAFYEAGNIGRGDAHPFPMIDMFGGVNMEMLDGPRHQALKSMALTAFNADALAGYVPDMERLVGLRLAEWSALSEFSATAELPKLAIGAICLNVMGLEPGPLAAAICRDYGFVLQGVVSVPVGVPGTSYRRARVSRDRLLKVIGEIVRQRRAEPSGDGLSRMLAARATGGQVYSDAEAVLEVHHMMIAGFVVYGLMAEVLRRVAEDPVLAASCDDEARRVAPATGPLSMASLSQLVFSTQVVNEAKRLAPLVPFAFGRAKRSFACGGYQVPEGWQVYLALGLLNRDPDTWRAPEQFDPARFGPERAEHNVHPLAFIPQGGGPPTGHQCLGLAYSTILTLTFLTILVRDYACDLPAQDLSYRWKAVPPVPRDGLKITLRRRS